MKEFEVILFYKYIRIAETVAFLMAQRLLCQRLAMKGRILIAEEGINGTLEGTRGNIEEYCNILRADSRFSDIAFKRSVGDGKAFNKLVIKVRPEIVTSGFGTLGNVDKRITGKHLKPEELKAWIENGKEFYIVDMRNDYEQKSGYFKGSILSGVRNFKDIPKFIPKLDHLKEKDILAVCTGGVRCEKASGLLMENGFENVYQLYGGMHAYMEKYPNEDFLGKLYVFDKRILVGFNMDSDRHKVVASCEKCGEQSENYVNCRYDECHRHYIICEPCNKKANGFCGLKCRLANRPVFRFFSRLVSSK